MNVLNRTALWVCVSAAMLLSSCTSGKGSLERRLQDEDPYVRIDAIVEAGQTRDRQAIPLLVDRLSDSDSDVRLWSKMALQKITGTTMGYNEYDPEPQRQAAIDRWRQWLETQNLPHTSTRQPASAAATAPTSRSSS